MCCCGKPVVNGEPGYSWDGKSFSVRPVSPPTLPDEAALLFDEPGRCGGLDCHSHHYRVVKKNGGFSLLVKHGGGEEHIRISNGKAVVQILESLDSTQRYWILSAMFYAQSDASRTARGEEQSLWRHAAAQGRIKTRKVRGTNTVKIWIEPRKDQTACYSMV